eukprot:scaffold56327_cov68-Phaeocystis_antarctica.AAC.5
MPMCDMVSLKTDSRSNWPVAALMESSSILPCSSGISQTLAVGRVTVRTVRCSDDDCATRLRHRPRPALYIKQIVISLVDRDVSQEELVEHRSDLVVVVEGRRPVWALYLAHLGGLRSTVALVPCDCERQQLSGGEDRLAHVRVLPPTAAHLAAAQVTVVHKELFAAP